MENTQLPQNTISNKQQATSEEPNLPPGTFTYVDKKKKWKIALEIIGLLIILAIPVVLSLYKINYPASRIYEAIDPAYIQTTPSSYSTWGGFINAAQKFIQPVIAPIQPTVTPSSTPLPTSTPSSPGQTGIQSGSTPTAVPVYNTSPNQQPAQSQPQPQDQPYYAPQTIINPTNIPIPTSTPTPWPTATYKQSDQSQSQTQSSTNPAVVACYGKKNSDDCSYSSLYGNQITGKCWTSAGTLSCVGN